MYSKSVINSINNNAPAEPEQLSVALVSSGTACGSVEDFGYVGESPEGFAKEGSPLRVTRVPSASVLGSVSLADLRKWLVTNFEENPNLYYGATNRSVDWSEIQAFRKI